MLEHVKILKDYTSLVRAGKLNEAQMVLQKYWMRSNTKSKAVKPVKNDVVEKPKEKVKIIVDEVVDEYPTIDSLSKVKGIGKKTIKDIKVMFKNLTELKKALDKDNVALRDDVVEKLKGVLN